MRDNRISEDTVIPLGFLVLIGGGFVGGILWLTEIHTTAAQARDSIAEIKQDRVVDSDELKQISIRLARIEGILEEIKRRR